MRKKMKIPNWKNRMLALLQKNHNKLTFEEKMELISYKYYDKMKITYEEYVLLAIADEIEFFYNDTLYQIDYGIENITAMCITKYKEGNKVLIESINYSSIFELLDQFQIDGKRIREIWDNVSI